MYPQFRKETEYKSLNSNNFFFSNILNLIEKESKETVKKTFFELNIFLIHFYLYDFIIKPRMAYNSFNLNKTVYLYF